MFRIVTSVLAALTVAAFAAPALAEGADPAAILAGSPASAELSQPALDYAMSFGANALKDEAGAEEMSAKALEETSGAANTVIQSVTDQKLIAANSGNTVEVGGGISFGDVSFGDNAFTGFNGLGVIVVNTGANNNLQGAIGVNIVPN
jgi:hypothetical protein